MFAAGDGHFGGTQYENFKKRVEARGSENRVSVPGKISPCTDGIILDIQTNMAETLSAIFGRKERKPVK